MKDLKHTLQVLAELNEKLTFFVENFNELEVNERAITFFVDYKGSDSIQLQIQKDNLYNYRLLDPFNLVDDDCHKNYDGYTEWSIEDPFETEEGEE